MVIAGPGKKKNRLIESLDKRFSDIDIVLLPITERDPLEIIVERSIMELNSAFVNKETEQLTQLFESMDTNLDGYIYGIDEITSTDREYMLKEAWITEELNEQLVLDWNCEINVITYDSELKQRLTDYGGVIGILYYVP